ALVVDHYGLARPEHEALARGHPVLAIDDLADRALGADLVLDAGPARREADYRGLVRPGARLLLGPAYAAVRREFAALRDAALSRRDGRPVRRALIALGLADFGGTTAEAIGAVRGLDAGLAIDAAVGGIAPTLPALRALAAGDPGVTLHVDTRDMARLTAEADIGIGAAGSTSWERCTLGLPSVTLVLADNQQPAATALAEQGAALVVDARGEDAEAELSAAIGRLLAEADLRRLLAHASARVCDGLGAPRAAQALLEMVRPRDSLTH
ncbi:MAG: UDP-2,4-diacetamido-2,4,6-trideoxy-beta-L-altropyranose hydrolase, partial [Phenylobacterium sp.]